jgi:hypothetical protein
MFEKRLIYKIDSPGDNGLSYNQAQSAHEAAQGARDKAGETFGGFEKGILEDTRGELAYLDTDDARSEFSENIDKNEVLGSLSQELQDAYAAWLEDPENYNNGIALATILQLKKVDVTEINERVEAKMGEVIVEARKQMVNQRLIEERKDVELEAQNKIDAKREELIGENTEVVRNLNQAAEELYKVVSSLLGAEAADKYFAAELDEEGLEKLINDKALAEMIVDCDARIKALEAKKGDAAKEAKKARKELAAFSNGYAKTKADYQAKLAEFKKFTATVTKDKDEGLARLNGDSHWDDVEASISDEAALTNADLDTQRLYAEWQNTPKTNIQAQYDIMLAMGMETEGATFDTMNGLIRKEFDKRLDDAREGLVDARVGKQKENAIDSARVSIESKKGELGIDAYQSAMRELAKAEGSMKAHRSAKDAAVAILDSRIESAKDYRDELDDTFVDDGVQEDAASRAERIADRQVPVDRRDDDEGLEVASN